jgi:hypothetical protein
VPYLKYIGLVIYTMLTKLDKAPPTVGGFSVFRETEEYFVGTLPNDITYYVVCERSNGDCLVRYYLDDKYKIYEHNIFMKGRDCSFRNTPYFARMLFPENTDLELVFRS